MRRSLLLIQPRRWMRAALPSAMAAALLVLLGCQGASVVGPPWAVLTGHGAEPGRPSAVTLTGAHAASPTPSSQATHAPAAVVTRIVVDAAGIDLPVISGDLPIRGQGPHMYPPCDVALYHTSFGQPGEGRTTYLYAHARDGMFLSLLTAAERDGGASLIGAQVEVYTSDDRLHRFTITRFKRHARGFALVDDAPRGTEQLILQTSEGPRGTVPKLQVLALPEGVEETARAQARPAARPRPCYEG